jgi:CBS domain-containing membrane protein
MGLRTREGTETVLTAADVMTPGPLAVTETDTVAAAWELLAAGNFHHLPVVRGEVCVGVLDDRTLLRAWRPGGYGRARRPVGELLGPSCLTVGPSLTIGEVADRLCAARIDAAPVVDGDGRLLGVVTAWDLVHVLAAHPPGGRPRW